LKIAAQESNRSLDLANRLIIANSVRFHDMILGERPIFRANRFSRGLDVTGSLLLQGE
jgi:hypothetical protein